MADGRINSRGFTGQPHAVGHVSPPSGGAIAASSPRAIARENSPPRRGPRTLLLRRGENGFGFTLRHFIVYPPESCCMLPGHERTKIDEPMDTIFVKQVRGNSPAAEAGLRTGDRVVSVDGKPTRGEQYASVVQRIQQAGPWLRLLVVSREDDILQRYFGDTAHNPETNQRPRLRSPGRSTQRQRRSVSLIPSGLSPRTRQSWVCSMPTADSDRLTDSLPRDHEFSAWRDGEITVGRTTERNPGNQDTFSEVGGIKYASENGPHGTAGVVFRRQKKDCSEIADEDRATRRVSYLKATWGERMHVDSDLDLSDNEAVHASRSGGSTGSGQDDPPDTDVIGRDVESVEREGSLHVKFTVLDGKRSTDRSWKQVWSVLRGPILSLYKDRHSQSPPLSADGENVGQNSMDVRCSLVDIADDYAKRKHVLRLTNPSAEILLQTEGAASMALWLCPSPLHDHATAEKSSDRACSSTSKQQAVPQTPASSSSGSSAATDANLSNSSQRLSPLPGHNGLPGHIKKLTSFRNRSPTGQSPVNKTRKPSQTVESLASPKSKTWKGRVAKQLRKMHGQTGSPSSPTAQLPAEGATFKVPLELCPSSSFSEFVPLIVEICTSIVEARGLEVVGIYRVPGNTAAIAQLTESINKGFENMNLQDPRWGDVHVISSLLKSFFRQLPDSLLTAELYPMFIDADKVEDPQRRMTTIRKLLRDLPEHHFETLKYLMFHLKKIVEHSEVNKMEAKNLAIVFGPTLVRASGSRDNMVTMVTDMSHQCRIVESLLNNVDRFFSDDDLDDLSRLSVNFSLPADGCEIETASSTTSHNLLLNNIRKVEGTREIPSARDVASSVVSAASRRV